MCVPYGIDNISIFRLIPCFLITLLVLCLQVSLGLGIPSDRRVIVIGQPVNAMHTYRRAYIHLPPPLPLSPNLSTSSPRFIILLQPIVTCHHYHWAASLRHHHHHPSIVIIIPPSFSLITFIHHDRKGAIRSAVQLILEDSTFSHHQYNKVSM